MRSRRPKCGRKIIFLNYGGNYTTVICSYLKFRGHVQLWCRKPQLGVYNYPDYYSNENTKVTHIVANLK